MNASALDEFRTILARRFGWRFESDRGQLAQVLASRIGLYQSPAAYLAALATAPPDDAEVRTLAETLAVSETYFFRNPDQFAVLDEIALPTMIARKPGRAIRILSAGAASGEEAYSIAITILQARRRQPVGAVEIVGVDVSRRAVERARRGRYSAWALRGLPPALTSEYFEQDGAHFQIAPRVASMVRFNEGNLLDLSRIAPGPWDIVFCRNTFMYFSADAAVTLFSDLQRGMTPGGFLFLGHAETLRGVSDAFALRHSHDTFYYVLGDAALPLATAVPATRSAPAPVPPATEDDAWFHEIARATERIAALVDNDHSAPPAPAASPAVATPSRATCVADALALLAQDRPQAALDALGHGSEPERLLLRSVLLVSLGRVDEARAACAAVLAADSRHAGAYYVQALCEERLHRDSEAVRHDEMAIYLDETFAMPQLHLAMLARRRHDVAVARRHIERARDLFAGEDQLRILMFGGGFSRQSLIQMCDTQLRALAS